MDELKWRSWEEVDDYSKKKDDLFLELFKANEETFIQHLKLHDMTKFN